MFDINLSFLIQLIKYLVCDFGEVSITFHYGQ